MGIRIMNDKHDEMASLYCSTSNVAFGPVFYPENELGRTASEEAQAFLDWCDGNIGQDIRQLKDCELSDAHYRYRLMRMKNEVSEVKETFWEFPFASNS